MLKGTQVYLRAMEPQDLELLYQWENNPANWEVSGTLTPYSKNQLKQFIEDSQHDIFTLKQARFMICKKDSNVIGTLDLFEFDPQHKRAGVGILIGDESERNKGFALEALQILSNYAENKLHLTQLFCTISSKNSPSIRLFEKAGYTLAGTKKSWLQHKEGLHDACFYQLIF